MAKNRLGIAEKRFKIVNEKVNFSKEKVILTLKPPLSPERLDKLPYKRKTNLKVLRNHETSYFSTFRSIEKLGSSKRKVKLQPNQDRKIFPPDKKHSHSDVRFGPKKEFKISLLSSPTSKSHNLGNIKYDAKLYQFCVFCVFTVIML